MKNIPAILTLLISLFITGCKDDPVNNNGNPPVPVYENSYFAFETFSMSADTELVAWLDSTRISENDTVKINFTVEENLDSTGASGNLLVTGGLNVWSDTISDGNYEFNLQIGQYPVTSWNLYIASNNNSLKYIRLRNIKIYKE